MTIDAKSIVRRVVETLQDTTSVRWPIAELVRYLNDGQREVALYRPDALVTTELGYKLATGTKQTVPEGGSKLIDVPRNAANGPAIRLINREILDAQLPNWHTVGTSVPIKHFMFDPRDPKTFYVYPAVALAGVGSETRKVDIVYSVMPDDVPEPGAANASWDDVTDSLHVPDIFANVVQDYMLYRAYSKDSDYAGNVQRAQAHYAAFANSLGIEIKATVAVGPVSVGNPNFNAARPAV